MNSPQNGSDGQDAPLPYQAAAGAPTNGFAITGLICGIAGFVTCGLAAIAGLIFSILGLQKSKQIQRGRGMAIAGIIVSSITILLVPLVLLMSIMLPALARAREKANQVKCASNLRQVGAATWQYLQVSGERDARLPSNFDTLAAMVALPVDALVCPSTSDDTGHFSSGPCTYFWVGQNLSTKSDPTVCIVAYEPLSNHADEGANFLFLDGHVEFIEANFAERVIEDLEAGINPPDRPGRR